MMLGSKGIFPWYHPNKICKGMIYIMLKKKILTDLYETTKEDADFREALLNFSDNITMELTMFNQSVRSEICILSGHANLLEQKNPNLTEQEEWKYLKENIKNLSNLLNQYEIYRSRFECHYGYVNIPELCQKIVSTFQRTALARHIRLTYKENLTERDAYTNYFCDPYQLQEVIIELLKHAFHTIPDVTYVDITISNENTDDFIIYVKRDGKMISEDDLNNIEMGHISKELFERHSAILLCHQFARKISNKFIISSNEETTFVELHLSSNAPYVPIPPEFQELYKANIPTP